MGNMPIRPAVLVALALGGAGLAGCANIAVQVGPKQKAVAAETGIVIARLGCATRRALKAKTFELTAVEVPGGQRWQIPFDPALIGDDGSSAAFLVNLPPGRYRLTSWKLTAGERAWGGEDAGVAIEVVAGEIACAGGVYVQPREHSRAMLDGSAAPAVPEVRDECAALADLLRERAPKLTSTPVVRLARSVVRAPSSRAALAPTGSGI
jgi:hypothetical protein